MRRKQRRQQSLADPHTLTDLQWLSRHLSFDGLEYRVPPKNSACNKTHDT